MSNALSRKKKKMQPLGYSMNEILGIQQYAKVQNNTNYLIEQSFENIKIIAYQILHDKFGFGNKRIIRVENTINAYLDSVADVKLSTAELEYYMKTKLGNCLKSQFKFSSRQIREVFEWIRYYINSLSGKYLDMVDVASVLYHECNYCDRRFIGKFREI